MECEIHSNSISNVRDTFLLESICHVLYWSLEISKSLVCAFLLKYRIKVLQLLF